MSLSSYSKCNGHDLVLPDLPQLPAADSGRVLSSEFWPELQFLAQLLPDFGGIMLTSF